MYTNDVTWPAAYFTVADMLYKQYGDVRPIIRHYDSFKAFIQFIRDNYLKDDIVIHDTFGDWCMPPESMEMIHSQDPSPEDFRGIALNRILLSSFGLNAEICFVIR